jgi:hypothetical protein
MRAPGRKATRAQRNPQPPGRAGRAQQPATKQDSDTSGQRGNQDPPQGNNSDK